MTLRPMIQAARCQCNLTSRDRGMAEPERHPSASRRRVEAHAGRARVKGSALRGNRTWAMYMTRVGRSLNLSERWKSASDWLHRLGPKTRWHWRITGWSIELRWNQPKHPARILCQHERGLPNGEGFGSTETGCSPAPPRSVMVAAGCFRGGGGDYNSLHDCSPFELRIAASMSS
jgi:hypothetical protein